MREVQTLSKEDVLHASRSDQNFSWEAMLAISFDDLQGLVMRVARVLWTALTASAIGLSGDSRHLSVRRSLDTNSRVFKPRDPRLVSNLEILFLFRTGDTNK